MAMRTFVSLIKLARFKCENLQKQMATLEASRADLEAKVEQLEASVPGEQIAAAESREGFVAYGSYAQSVIKRKANLRASITEVDVEIDELRDELEDAFAELKKYELMEERRVARLKGERKKRDQAQLDEIATQRSATG